MRTILSQKINRVFVQVTPQPINYCISSMKSTQAFDSTESLEVRAIFLDISKVVDKVWHNGLIFKLEQSGISGRLLILFKNYLRNMKQCVVLNGSFSDYSDIEAGVP